jgi:hypothetical protein
MVTSHWHFFFELEEDFYGITVCLFDLNTEENNSE